MRSELEQEIINDQANRMQKTQDFEILSSLLCEIGWTRVDIHYHMTRTWYEVKAWAEENCRGEHQEHLGYWLFENPTDATWFKMRWL